LGRGAFNLNDGIVVDLMRSWAAIEVTPAASGMGSHQGIGSGRAVLQIAD
jgi:hypothetical protein